MLAAAMPRALPPAGRAAAAVALLALLAAVTRVSSWRKPLATDSGQYLYIGDLILDGGTPYVDAVNNKGPLTYLLFAAIRLGAGTSMTAVRLALLAFAVVAAVALGAYVAHHAGRAAGVLAALAFALFAGLPAFQGDDPNTEQFGVAFMVGSWWLATRAGSSPRWGLAAGGAAAAAVAINPTFVVALPIVAFELWRARPRRRVRALALGVAGGVAVAGPLLVWLLAAGALDEMWTEVVERAGGSTDGSFDRGGVPDTGPAGAAGGDDAGSGSFAVPAGGLWLAGIAGLLLGCTERRLRRVALPLLATVALGWARVKVATYEFPHHYYPVLPALAAGLALGIARAWPLVARPRLRWALAAAVLALPLWQWVVVPERDALAVPAAERWGPGFESFALAYPIAEFIRANTKPGDRILVAGTDPEVYWLADRHANTRYFDVFPLLREGRYIGARANDVVYDPPAAIVAMPNAEVADPYFPALLNLGRYPPAYEVEGARVWLRR
jgi:4-amino-4-deoxy-L-arabinose transferase-like glycosyltransferase